MIASILNWLLPDLQGDSSETEILAGYRQMLARLDEINGRMK